MVIFFSSPVPRPKEAGHTLPCICTHIRRCNSFQPSPEPKTLQCISTVWIIVQSTTTIPLLRDPYGKAPEMDSLSTIGHPPRRIKKSTGLFDENPYPCSSLNYLTAFHLFNPELTGRPCLIVLFASPDAFCFFPWIPKSSFCSFLLGILHLSVRREIRGTAFTRLCCSRGMVGLEIFHWSHGIRHSRSRISNRTDQIGPEIPTPGTEYHTEYRLQRARRGKRYVPYVVHRKRRMLGSAIYTRRVDEVAAAPSDDDVSFGFFCYSSFSSSSFRLVPLTSQDRSLATGDSSPVQYPNRHKCRTRGERARCARVAFEGVGSESSCIIIIIALAPWPYPRDRTILKQATR